MSDDAEDYFVPSAGLVTYGPGSDMDTDTEHEHEAIPVVGKITTSYSTASTVVEITREQVSVAITEKQEISVDVPVKKSRLDTGLLSYGYDDEEEDDVGRSVNAASNDDKQSLTDYDDISDHSDYLPKAPTKRSSKPPSRGKISRNDTPPSDDPHKSYRYSEGDAISTDEEERETRRLSRKSRKDDVDVASPSNHENEENLKVELKSRTAHSKKSKKSSHRRPPTPPPPKQVTSDDISQLNFSNYISTSLERRSTNDRVQEIVLPPEPPVQMVDPDLQRTVQVTIERMRADSRYDPNKVIQDNKLFRNPSIYEKLVSFVEIDEKGSNFPKDKYNPKRWINNASYYDELAKVQDAEIKKRDLLKKDSTGGKKLEFVTVVKSASGVTKTETSSSLPEKKRSKWDAPPNTVAAAQVLSKGTSSVKKA